MEMIEFILATFGEELKRACTYDRGDSFCDGVLADLLTIHEHFGIVAVEIRWWKQGECRVGIRFAYNYDIVVAPQAECVEAYVADCELPPEPGYKLQVAITTAQRPELVQPSSAEMIDETLQIEGNDA